MEVWIQRKFHLSHFSNTFLINLTSTDRNFVLQGLSSFLDTSWSSSPLCLFILVQFVCSQKIDHKNVCALFVCLQWCKKHIVVFIFLFYLNIYLNIFLYIFLFKYFSKYFILLVFFCGLAKFLQNFL